VKKYLRERLQGIMKLNDPPHKLALAFAIGVFIAFSPWLGLHVISCFFFAWLFRVSKVVVLAGAFVNNPWTMVPMYAFSLWFGIKITGGTAEVPKIAWSTLGFRDLFSVLLPFLWPFVAGSLVIGCIAAVLSYFLFFWLIKRYRREEVKLAEVDELLEESEVRRKSELQDGTGSSS
jgi:uncharacterized protein (DUF2062 family)